MGQRILHVVARGFGLFSGVSSEGKDEKERSQICFARLSYRHFVFSMRARPIWYVYIYISNLDFFTCLTIRDHMETSFRYRESILSDDHIA